MAKILEHVVAKWLSIADCDFSQNAKVADDVLPKKNLDCHEAYVGDWLGLNLLVKYLTATMAKV
jgi:hypothetical protein